MLPERVYIAAVCQFLAVHCLDFITELCACRSLQALCRPRTVLLEGEDRELQRTQAVKEGKGGKSEHFEVGVSCQQLFSCLT